MNVAPTVAPPAGPRHRRRPAARRVRREQWLAVFVLVAVFLATVLLLGLQWLAPGASGAGAAAAHVQPVTEVT